MVRRIRQSNHSIGVPKVGKAGLAIFTTGTLEECGSIESGLDSENVFQDHTLLGSASELVGPWRDRGSGPVTTGSCETMHEKWFD